MVDYAIAVAIGGAGLAYIWWSINHPSQEDQPPLEVALAKRLLLRLKNRSRRGHPNG